MAKPIMYLSMDIEATGPIPGPNSMISLGAAMFSEDGVCGSTFSVNLKELPGSFYDPDTLEWWQDNTLAWDQATENPQDPQEAMESFIKWVKTAAGDSVVVPVCYPAAFDYMFIYWYLKSFLTDCSPFSFSCLDIKSFAAAKLNIPYRNVNKKTLPKADTPHTHIAVEDAIGQGEIFIKLLKLP